MFFFTAQIIYKFDKQRFDFTGIGHLMVPYALLKWGLVKLPVIFRHHPHDLLHWTTTEDMS